MKSPEVSIVIPLFNEAESLPRLAEEIRDSMQDTVGYEVLFVDDGSSDESFSVLQGIAAADARVRILHLGTNAGQSAALAIGFRHSRGEVIVTLDADLQNDPADIPRLIAELDGADLVSGVRARRRDSWLRRLCSRVANRVRSRVLGDGISDVGCSLKAYRRPFLEALPSFDGMHRFLPALVLMVGGRVKEIPVTHRPRHFGETKYGIHDRLWRGVVDLLGVRWLKSRWVRTDVPLEVLAHREGERKEEDRSLPPAGSEAATSGSAHPSRSARS